MHIPTPPTRNAAFGVATTPADCDVAIVGAGPYGLAAAAHLAPTHGLEVRVFGRSMSFWDEQMPRGMLLRSAPHFLRAAEGQSRLRRQPCLPNYLVRRCAHPQDACFGMRAETAPFHASHADCGCTPAV